jgi:hypothetical protein
VTKSDNVSISPLSKNDFTANTESLSPIVTRSSAEAETAGVSDDGISEKRMFEDGAEPPDAAGGVAIEFCERCGAAIRPGEKLCERCRGEEGER